MKYLALTFCWLASAYCAAQNFEVEQIEQLFRPRLRVDARRVFNSPFADTTGDYNSMESAIVFTFPIKTRLGADIKLDLSSGKLKDILKNSLRLKLSQTLGIVRLNARQAHLGFDAAPDKNLAGATVGLLGLRLTRKYRIMFWSAGVNVSEQNQTLNRAVPRASALIGQLHLRGIRRNFFYGLAIAYSDKLWLPLPFFGGSVPVGQKFIFNYTLPAQLTLQYRPGDRFMIAGGINLDGYRSGIEYHLMRSNVNYTSLTARVNLRYKFGKALIARLEGGYIAYQNLRYSQTDIPQKNFPLGSGPYVQAGFSVLFGKTIWEKIVDNVTFN